MPSQGYSTIGLKPSIISELQRITDQYYPGMFLPSTLIITMNEVKRGYYIPEMHNIKVDLSGRYNSLTIRSDVKEWLEENYKNLFDLYTEKYGIDNFAQFVSYFIMNLFQSKVKAQEQVIRIKASEFKWLIQEYKKRKKQNELEIATFDQFADEFLRELLEKINEAKKILST
jgi:hypothetical protein